MATYTAEDTHFVRIGGVVNASNVLYTFTTRTPPGTWSSSPASVSVNALHSPIETKPASMKFLGTLATSPSISFALAQRAEVAALLRAKSGAATVVKSTSDASSVRLTRFASKAAGSLLVTDSAPFSIGNYYWIGAQAIKVTAKPSGTTLTVLRGQLGTYAEAIPMPTVGATIHTSPPTVKGLPVTAGVIDSAGDEEIRFRGFVDSVNLSSGLMLSIGVRSVVQHIRDRLYTVPRAESPTPRPLIAGGGDITTGSISVQAWAPMLVDTEKYGPSVADGGEAWTRVRWVGAGGKWIVTTVAYLDTETIGGRQFDRYTHTPAVNPGAVHTIPAHAFGEKDAIWELGSTEARLEHMRAVFLDLDRAEWALTYTYGNAPTWGALVLDILTRDEPHGSGMDIHTDYLAIGYSGTGDAALPEVGRGLPGLLKNTDLGRDAWVMPALESKKWSEALRDAFFRPIWRGLGVDSTARLRAMNWLDTDATEIATPAAITSAHATGKAEYKLTDSQTSPVGLYALTFARLSRFIGGRRGEVVDHISDELEVSVYSPDVGSSALANPDRFRVPGTFAGDVRWNDDLTALAMQAVMRFGATVRELTIELQPTIALVPGDRFTITMPHLPDADGSVDVDSAPTMRGIALGVGIDKGRILGTRLAITGYTDDPTPTRGTWAPAATLTAWDGGAKYGAIGANDWTDSAHARGVNSDYKAWDLLDWGAGETAAVIICNADLSTRGTATLSNVHPSLGLKLTGSSVTPASGNVIVPASYDSQTSAWLAATYTANVGGPVVHLSGTNALVGAAGDDAWGWS